MRRFRVTYSVTVEVSLADAVVEEATSPDWKKEFYDLRGAAEVADHLAYNAVANGVYNVTNLDGFAHLNRDQVQYSNPAFDLEDIKEIA